MTAWFSPGRIEVLGKHTDYAGGESLLAALDRGVTATISEPRVAGVSTAGSDASPGEVTLRAGTLPEGHWGRYLLTVLGRLERNFGPLAPCHIAVSSDLPLASGMSSSSALVVAAALALADHHGISASARWRDQLSTPEDLATYLACIENGSAFGDLVGDEGVGTFGGSEDHTAMLCCRAGHLARYAFAPTRALGHTPVPEDLVFVVAVSGVLAEKTGAARADYNRASAAARAIVTRWNAATGRGDAHLGQAVASSPDAADRLARLVADEEHLAARLRHFVSESGDLVGRGVAALASGDLAAFGDVCARSQAQAEGWLGNQIPETVHLARSARTLGAHASSAFGAGYGGSVWALVDRGDADAFAAAWLADYAGAFPRHAGAADTVIGTPSGPARKLR